ncbi:MAG: hypothetical protein OQK04_09025 [Kangiellaceae bacterium]|nr:hypothetical protein [Kangiellaceae bacterium]MCW8998842.1 hypothetical protein [Kangiellaceae bacterium]
MNSNEKKKQMLENKITYKTKTIYFYKQYSYEKYADALEFAISDRQKILTSSY